MSRNQSLTKVVFVMPFIHIFKDPYKTSYQKSVILHFQTFSSNLLDFYIVSFLSSSLFNCPLFWISASLSFSSIQWSALVIVLFLFLGDMS